MPKGNPKGGPGVAFGSKARSHSQLSKRFSMELAIRYSLVNPGCTTADIAKHINIAPATLNNWMASGEYKELHNQLTTNVLGSIDAELAHDIGYQRVKLQRMVPLALQNLANLAVQQSDRKLQFEASKEILDREGNLSKVSRIGLPSETQGGAGSKVDHDTANSLFASLQLAKSLQNSQSPATPKEEKDEP